MRTALNSSVLLLLSRKQPGWEAWRDCLQTVASEGELLKFARAYFKAADAMLPGGGENMTR